jgi:acylglycerol lipase
MRIVFALILSAILAACAGQGTGHLAAPAVLGNAVPPDGPAREPQLAEKAFVADDGTALPLRTWLPQGKPKAVILALHGFNDYSNAFTAPAEEWAKHGIATYAYDQRGFGEAPQRGRWAGAYQLTGDLAAASRVLRTRYGKGVPLYLLGESMGGAVVISAVTGAAGAPRPLADGIILVAPAVWGRRTMNVFERVALWTGDQLFPSMTLTGRGLNITPSDNIEMLRALSRDKLVIKETRVDTIKGLVDLMDMALAAAPRVTEPMLFLYGARDEIVPRQPTELWLANLPVNERMTRRIALYEDGYHMLLRDLEAPLVWHDVESWLADHRAPLPSAADHRASEALFVGG